MRMDGESRWAGCGFYIHAGKCVPACFTWSAEELELLAEQLAIELRCSRRGDVDQFRRAGYDCGWRDGHGRGIGLRKGKVCREGGGGNQAERTRDAELANAFRIAGAMVIAPGLQT